VPDEDGRYGPCDRRYGPGDQSAIPREYGPGDQNQPLPVGAVQAELELFPVVWCSPAEPPTHGVLYAFSLSYEQTVSWAWGGFECTTACVSKDGVTPRTDATTPFHPQWES
jgi:hypothetical protein